MFAQFSHPMPAVFIVSGGGVYQQRDGRYFVRFWDGITFGDMTLAQAIDAVKGR